jgi:hypothetical protein
MRTDSFYKIVIVLLLLVNIGTLGYLILPKRAAHTEGNEARHHGPPRPDRIIIERLNLTEPQQELFEGLKHEHHGQMMDIQEESGKLHKALFELLKKDNVDIQVKDSLLVLIQQTNLQKEQVTFDHFQKLRAILTENQKNEFDDFVEDISQRIMGPHRPGRN